MKYLVICFHPTCGTSIELETNDLNEAVSYCNVCNAGSESRYTIYTEADV